MGNIKSKKVKNELTVKIPKYLEKRFEVKPRIVLPIELVTVPIPWDMLSKIENIKKLQKELEQKNLVLVPMPKKFIK